MTFDDLFLLLISCHLECPSFSFTIFTKSSMIKKIRTCPHYFAVWLTNLISHADLCLLRQCGICSRFSHMQTAFSRLLFLVTSELSSSSLIIMNLYLPGLTDRQLGMHIDLPTPLAVIILEYACGIYLPTFFTLLTARRTLDYCLTATDCSTGDNNVPEPVITVHTGGTSSVHTFEMTGPSR